LAAYIFGGNGRRQSIAMTAPVAQTPAAGAWTVRFTMPRAYALNALPKPNDPRVRLTALPAGRFAVIRFSGLASKGDVAARTRQLAAFAQSRHLTTTGPASLAQYDPPWTPWFMRRNEVMLPIRP
jgi:effector-binding domain-containing protein